MPMLTTQAPRRLLLVAVTLAVAAGAAPRSPPNAVEPAGRGRTPDHPARRLEPGDPSPYGKTVPRPVVTYGAVPGGRNGFRQRSPRRNPSPLRGAFPLVVFGHGFAVTPSIYARAAAGLGGRRLRRCSAGVPARKREYAPAGLTRRTSSTSPGT